jgi:CheY-like chemotaxis protein
MIMAKILVVDDSLVDQRLAGRLLVEPNEDAYTDTPTEVTVIYANDGRQALDLIPQQKPDLILTDLQMPELNGLELVDEVKARFPSLPVILMTGHGSEDIALQALKRGAASYVPKQKLAVDLRSTVDDILSVSRARREQQRLLDECWMQSESHFLLGNDLSHIPALIVHLQENLTRLKVCDENDLIRVAVALREALSNAIIHGNLEVSSQLREVDEKLYYAQIEERRHDPAYRDRNVYIIAEESRTQAVYILRDDGPGFDHANLPDPTEEANLGKVSGRGLFLIRTFMDHVEFNAKGNQITMIKRRCHS